MYGKWTASTSICISVYREQKIWGEGKKIIIYKLEGGGLELMNQNGSAVAFIEELHECRLN
jgi:hypothetical protein